jgi:DNA-binding transcriptional LysR family regulator
MPFNIDTALLKSFIAAAEAKSFSDAAKLVGRSQSAFSLQIQRLEEALSCQLFDRRSKQIRLNEKGKKFLIFSKKTLQLQREVHDELNSCAGTTTIRLGMPEDFATHYMPKILAKFHEQHPTVHVEVKCDFTLNLLSAFQDGQLDMILVKRDPETVKGGTRVWQEPLVWVGKKQLKPQNSLNLILSPEPCIYRARALAALDRARKPYQIVYTSPSLAGTIAAVEEGLGISVLPEAMMPKTLNKIDDPWRLPHLAKAEIALIKQSELNQEKLLFAHYISGSIQAIQHRQ